MRGSAGATAYQAKAPLGGTFGAWLVEDANGARAVLKAPWRSDQRQRVEAIAALLASLDDGRAPRILASGYEPSIGTWYLQEHVDGVPLGQLDARHVPEVFAFIETLAGRSHLAEELPDWQQEVVRSTLSAWSRTAAELRPHCADLVESFGSVIVSSEIPLSAPDVVHGDFLVTQLLVADDAISGIVDWDFAGRGDRAFDLALLFVNIHAQADRGHGSADSAQTLAAVNCQGISVANNSFTVYVIHHLVQMLLTAKLGSAANLDWRIDLARRVWRSVERYG